MNTRLQNIVIVFTAAIIITDNVKMYGSIKNTTHYALIMLVYNT